MAKPKAAEKNPNCSVCGAECQPVDAPFPKVRCPNSDAHDTYVKDEAGEWVRR
jgi:hypothetical protein